MDEERERRGVGGEGWREGGGWMRKEGGGWVERDGGREVGG